MTSAIRSTHSHKFKFIAYNFQFSHLRHCDDFNMQVLTELIVVTIICSIEDSYTLSSNVSYLQQTEG
jgi:hypothetical protein